MTNQNYEISTHTPQNGHPPKDLQRFSAAKGEGDKESAYSVDGDGNGWVQPGRKTVRRLLKTVM